MQFQDRPLPPQPSYTASWTGISSSSSTSLPAPAASSSAPPERKGTRTSARFTLSATHRPAPRPPIESHELPQSQPQPQRLPQATGSYGYSYNYSDTFNSLDSKSRARRTKAGSGSSSSMGAHSKTHSHSASTTTQPWYETAYERKIVVERKRAIRNKVRTAVSLHVELEENDYVPVDEVGRIYSDTIDNSNRANDVIAEELTAPRRRFGTPPAQYERLEEPLRDREAEIDLVEESLSLIPSARGQCARRFLSPLSLMCPQDCRTCGTRVPAPMKPSPTPMPKRHGATTPSGLGLGLGTRPQGRSPSAELLDVTGLAGLGGLAAIRIDGESASGKGVGLPRPPSVVRS